MTALICLGSVAVAVAAALCLAAWLDRSDVKRKSVDDMHRRIPKAERIIDDWNAITTGGRSAHRWRS